MKATDRAAVAAGIRAKLASGRLPSAKPMKVWIGKGTDRPCMGCDEPIEPESIGVRA
jgi:hypothetical protein